MAEPKWKADAAILERQGVGRPWRVVSKRDPLAVSVFDRHYSRQTPGGEIGPPGRKIVLLSRVGGLALWCTHYPKPSLAMDKLDTYRCVVFRNESRLRASFLIKKAVEATEAIWGPPPPQGWTTWVESRKVESVNPGYCFKMAGWDLDRNWEHKKLVRLRLAS